MTWVMILCVSKVKLSRTWKRERERDGRLLKLQYSISHVKTNKAMEFKPSVDWVEYPTFTLRPHHQHLNLHQFTLNLSITTIEQVLRSQNSQSEGSFSLIYIYNLLFLHLSLNINSQSSQSIRSVDQFRHPIYITLSSTPYRFTMVRIHSSLTFYDTLPIQHPTRSHSPHQALHLPILDPNHRTRVRLIHRLILKSLFLNQTQRSSRETLESLNFKLFSMMWSFPLITPLCSFPYHPTSQIESLLGRARLSNLLTTLYILSSSVLKLGLTKSISSHLPSSPFVTAYRILLKQLRRRNEKDQKVERPFKPSSVQRYNHDVQRIIIIKNSNHQLET